MTELELQQIIRNKYGTIWEVRSEPLLGNNDIGRFAQRAAFVSDKTEGMNLVKINYFVEFVGNKEKENADFFPQHKKLFEKLAEPKTLEELEVERLKQAVDAKVFQAKVDKEAQIQIDALNG